MKVVQEEIFGPVVTAIPFKEIDELLSIANDSIYGLAAGIWTKDISRADEIIYLEEGQVKLQGSLPDVLQIEGEHLKFF